MSPTQPPEEAIVTARQRENTPVKHLARLHVQRGTNPVAPSVEIFEVPFEPGQSVLDALRWIRSHRDPSLAFRFSCINANACKECMMKVDDKVMYACMARLVDGDLRLAPLGNKPLVRDLVSEIAPPDERLRCVEGEDDLPSSDGAEP